MHPTPLSPRHTVPLTAFVALAVAAFAFQAAAQTIGKTPAKNADSAPDTMERVAYTVYYHWPTPERFAGGLLIIAPADATEKKLIALGRQLHNEERAYPKVNFIILNDTKAAAIFQKPMSEQTSAEKEYLFTHNVARYLRNQFNGVEDMDISPKGIGGPDKLVPLNGK